MGHRVAAWWRGHPALTRPGPCVPDEEEEEEESEDELPQDIRSRPGDECRRWALRLWSHQPSWRGQTRGLFVQALPSS